MRLFAFVLVSCALLMANQVAAGQVIEKTFTESDGLVMNPDCGWVAYNYGDSYALRKRVAGDQEPYALASVMYTRQTNKSWEDDAGSRPDSEPLKLLEDWMSHKRHVAFRIYCNQVADLPARLQGSIRTFAYTSGGEKGTAIAYWDPAYVEAHRDLVQFLAGRLGESPYLAFVDIGGVGDSGGEWCFGDADAFRRAGLDDETYYRLVAAFVDMYRTAFPHTRLYISFECIVGSGSHRKDAIDLLQRNHVGIRDDGLGGWPYPRQSPPLDTWPMPLLWKQMPVGFEGSGKGGGVYGWTLQGKDPAAVLDWAFRQSPPSFINIGGAETNSEKACQQLKPLLIQYGRRLGYRFILRSVSCPAVLDPASASELTMVWSNGGIAPCYVERRIEVSLFDAQGALVSAWAASPDPATTSWAPGQQVSVRVPLQVPASVPTGQYVLKVAMLLEDPRAPGEHLQIGSDGADADWRYAVGTVSVAQARP